MLSSFGWLPERQECPSSWLPKQCRNTSYSKFHLRVRKFIKNRRERREEGDRVREENEKLKS